MLRVQLRHQLSPQQIIALDECVAQIQRHLDPTSTDPDAGETTIDQKCLDLCIALLDHDLRGDLFDSAIVGYLAVLGIDAAKGTLRTRVIIRRSPASSRWLKCSSCARRSSPRPRSRARIRQTFLTTCATASCSMARDRPSAGRAAYACSLKRSVTRRPRWAPSVGRMTCNPYRTKTFAILPIASFRDFIAGQVEASQKQLEDLLLLHPVEQREDLGIGFKIHRLVDSAVENAKGSYLL